MESVQLQHFIFHCNIILLAELINLIYVTPWVLYSWNTCVDVGNCQSLHAGSQI